MGVRGMQSPQLDKDFYFFVDKQTSLGKKICKIRKRLQI